MVHDPLRPLPWPCQAVGARLMADTTFPQYGRSLPWPSIGTRVGLILGFPPEILCKKTGQNPKAYFHLGMGTYIGPKLIELPYCTDVPLIAHINQSKTKDHAIQMDDGSLVYDFQARVTDPFTYECELERVVAEEPGAFLQKVGVEEYIKLMVPSFPEPPFGSPPLKSLHDIDMHSFLSRKPR